MIINFQLNCKGKLIIAINKIIVFTYKTIVNYSIILKIDTDDYACCFLQHPEQQSKGTIITFDSIQIKRNRKLKERTLTNTA